MGEEMGPLGLPRACQLCRQLEKRLVRSPKSMIFRASWRAPSRWPSRAISSATAMTRLPWSDSLTAIHWDRRSASRRTDRAWMGRPMATFTAATSANASERSPTVGVARAATSASASTVEAAPMGPDLVMPSATAVNARARSSGAVMLRATSWARPMFPRAQAAAVSSASV